MRRRAWPRCGEPSGWISTLWSTAMRDRRRGWDTCSRKRWNRTVSTGSRSRAGRRWWRTWRRFSSVTTPIATGERVVGVHGFRPLLEARACSIIQPDITHCGGLTEARRIAALAEAYRVAMAPHNPQGPVSTAASLEFGHATPSYIICESVHLDVPWREDCVTECYVVEREGRLCRPGNRPGLGVEINEAEVRKHPFQPELPQRVFFADGSVGDW